MSIIEVGSLIERTPGIAGGRYCLAGTGMPVIQIAVHYASGESPNRILRHFPHLDLPRIHAAIAFYLANKAEMDREIEEEERQFQLEKQAQKPSAKSA